MGVSLASFLGLPEQADDVPPDPVPEIPIWHRLAQKLGAEPVADVSENAAVRDDDGREQRAG